MKDHQKLMEILAPDGTWGLREEIKDVMTQALGRLPASKDVSGMARRYPETPKDMSAFLGALFARHFFQAQDSLLQEAVLSRLLKSTESRHLVIADIGSGPAVASLATLDVLSAMNALGMLPPVSVTTVLNDTSAICLKTGRQMIDDYARKCRSAFPTVDVQTLDVPFPKSLPQLRRSAGRYGELNLAFLSYVLVPLKDDLKHSEMAESVNAIQQYASEDSTTLILQDKFHESLIRALGSNLKATTEKGQLQQTVYDEDNANDVHTYTYYRTVVA